MSNSKLKNKLRFVIGLLVMLLVFNLVPINQTNAAVNTKYEFENLKSSVDFKEAILEACNEPELLVKVEDDLLRELDKESDNLFAIKDNKEFEFDSVIEKEDLKLDSAVN